MDLNEIYFWTATLNNWEKLFWENKFKDVIIDSLQYLHAQSKIDFFGFVIMPTHLHLIWRMLSLNGKESPYSSFMKYTAHTFKSILLLDDPDKLNPFKVDRSNKNFEFWQRDSLAIRLFTQKVAMQKLNYIHNNPLASHWKLASAPGDYYYSSASFYEFGERKFSFLKDLRKEI